MQSFDPVQYKIDYPQFAGLSDTLLTKRYDYNALARSQWVFNYFTNADQQYYWSIIVLSHILTLEYGVDGTGSSGMIGRINSATEDSVSATAEFNTPLESGSAYWNQTIYGCEVWSIWASHGIATYVPEDFHTNSWRTELWH